MAFAEGYIDVATRLVEFRDKHPEGSLQPADLSKPYTVETIGDQTRIVVVAAAYRTADDARPGIGMAYEEVPGKTPYTRGSELQNAETSAWGRAIVAALAADTRKGVASADEVRNRQAERESSQEPTEEVKLRLQIREWSDANNYDPAVVMKDFHHRMRSDIREAAVSDLHAYLEHVKANGIEPEVPLESEVEAKA
jgi:hypothetical protein